MSQWYVHDKGMQIAGAADSDNLRITQSFEYSCVDK